MRILILLLAAAAHAQIGGGSFPGPGVKGYGAPPPTSSWEAVPIAHGSTLGSGGGTSRHVGPLDCTGATHYFFAISAYGTGVAAGTPVYDDGTPHNFTLVSGEASNATPTSVAIWWAEVTGSASSSVEFSATTDYGPVFAACWKIGLGSSSKDQESASGTVTCYPCSPSLTPTVNDSLVLFISSTDGGTTGVSAAGYTILDSRDYTGGLSMGGIFGYRILSGGSGVAQNPTFSNSGGGAGTVKMVNFKPI